MSSSNGMFTKQQRLQEHLGHGDEIGHKRGVKEKILTTTAGIIATGITMICFIAIALGSLA